MDKLKKNEIRWSLTLICFALVLLLGVIAVISPDATKATMGSMFNFTIFKLGSGFLWYAMFGTVIIAYFAFSKFGNIHLGGNKPQYSKFKLFAMALSAGMGASTMYWAFIEQVYYYMDPQFGIVDNAIKLEEATAYQLFHWGPVGWVTYLMCGIPFMVVFYVLKGREMSLSGVANTLFDNKLPSWLLKLFDLLFIITSLAATALTLGLAIPMISAVVSNLTGISNTMTLGIGIILGMALIFSLSSYIGLEKGMAKLSSATVYICIILVAVIFVVGPSTLMLNNTTNAIGILIHDYFRMSLNTAPFSSTGFPQYWTIFFLANWISYAPGMGIFITKIAKGHKLRDVILVLTLGGAIGTTIIFGICGTYTLNLMNLNIVDAVSLISNGEAAQLVHGVFASTPFPGFITVLYLVSMILFCVTTLDGTSFSLASITTKKVDNEGNVSPVFRLFWCLLLTAVPIIFTLIGADLNILKSFPVLIIVPMLPIFAIMLYRTMTITKRKYGCLSAKEISENTITE